MSRTTAQHNRCIKRNRTIPYFRPARPSHLRPSDVLLVTLRSEAPGTPPRRSAVADPTSHTRVFTPYLILTTVLAIVSALDPVAVPSLCIGRRLGVLFALALAVSFAIAFVVSVAIRLAIALDVHVVPRSFTFFVSRFFSPGSARHLAGVYPPRCLLAGLVLVAQPILAVRLSCLSLPTVAGDPVLSTGNGGIFVFPLALGGWPR